MLFNNTRNVLIIFIGLTFVSLFIGGASCPDGAMGAVRDVHINIRSAFVQADAFIAPRFEVAGNECINEAQSAGLTGQAGSDASDECMSVWLQLDQAVTLTREAMAELEEVYEDIDNNRETEWQHVARRVFIHGRSVIRFLDELNIEGVDEILSSMRESLDRLCELINCEEGI